MRVIAIDPGYDRCGVAILQRGAKGEELLYSACITTTKEKTFSERLAQVMGEVRAVIEMHTPTEMALERLFFNKNQKTAMMVAEIRGALMGLGAELNLEVHEYTPGQVKVAVTGDGRSDKRQVAFMAQKLLRIQKKGLKDDEYDAMAVGITHLAHRGRN